MTDSDEVEKVLLSLESETSNVASTDGDPDKDKVEELLRQLEQEKEGGGGEGVGVGGDEVLDQSIDKPKLPSRLPKKTNGVNVGDKPAAPKKSSIREEIPKPWKKKGAVRKKPMEDEDFFAVKEPKLLETHQNDLPTTEPLTSPTTEKSEAVPLAATQTPPRSPPIRANPPPSLPESHEIPNGIGGHTTPPPSSPTPSHTSPTPYPASPIPASNSPIPPVSPTPQKDTFPSQAAHTTPQITPHTLQASPSIPNSPKLQATPSIPNSPNPKTVSPPPKSTSPPPAITLTTSTPPPSQRTSHEPTIKKEPQITPTKQKSAEEMLRDDSVKSDERVFSKQDFENLRNQILFQMNEETAILGQEFQELKAKYDEEIRGKAKLKSVLVEYEKTIAKLIDEAGMSVHHDKLAERVVELENETKRKTDEYDALASAHSELKSRYEETKTDNEKLKSNEQVQKEVISKLQNELHGSETRFNVLKSHAETKLDSASEQLVKMRDERAKEIAMMQTRMQKAEARTATVEKEKQELLVICDDLMHQLEQKNS